MLILVIVLIVVGVSKCTAPSEGGGSSSSSSTSSTGSTSSGETEPTAAPTATPAPTAPPEKNISDKKTETLGGIVVIDDAAYEYYNFVQSTGEEYIDIINGAATALKGKAELVEVIIPTSMGVILPDNIGDYLGGINVSDQKSALDWFYGSFISDVTKVNIFETMKLHNNEYIYFRTDHHWTALGAYYAYCDAVKAVGITPLSLDDYTITSYDNYLGSFYSDSQNDPALSKNPDRVDVYDPGVNATMEVTTADGTVYNYDSPFLDVTEYSSSLKYNTFIASDNPYTVITNNDTTSTDSCIVVKESFGNAFAPFLVPHYKNVYVIDYRYYSGKVQDLVDTTGAKHVYVTNNISMTRSSDRVSDLSTVF